MRAGARLAAAAMGVVLAGTGVAASEELKTVPTFTADGVTHVPPFDLPPSALMSKEGAAMLKMRAQTPAKPPQPSDDIDSARKRVEQTLAPLVATMLQRYPVDVAEQRIAGVPTRVVTPRGKPVDEKRILIDLHGGAFSICADACAILESAPIAALGGYKVVTVNYRMAPEAEHPAALEDVAAVYRELLKSYRPEHIGIYGCSAGGLHSG